MNCFRKWKKLFWSSKQNFKDKEIIGDFIQFESRPSHGKVWATWGSSYIPLPKFLAAKKAIINRNNENDECFKWAIIRALNSVKIHPERIDKKLRETSKTLNWEKLKFPVKFSDINKFEEHNSSISVNVFGYEKLVYPLRISEHNYKRESTVNHLLISDDTNQHFCWIKDISQLLSKQI